MFSLKDLLFELEKLAPLSLSHKMIEKGCYDNSGIIIENHDQVKGVLFTLDLSENAVKSAIEKGCDTIVTHHPAIYTPVKNLSVNGLTRAIVYAVKAGLNVISMHLNLDIADGGIDECLAKALGAKNAKIIEMVTENQGYGRLFEVDKTTLNAFVLQMKKTFGCDKIINYGTSEVQKVASFCGSGGESALGAVINGLIDADTIVTSDLAHHILLGLVEKNKNVVVIPHYVSENYGFNEFFISVGKNLSGKIKTFYFEDKRFM
jgi:dinuclear metal center YbgI/SA1388 family protein